MDETITSTTSGIKMHPRLLRQIDTFVGAAERLWPQHYRADSCIAAARVCVDVLSAYRYRVEPLPVLCEVTNGVYVAKGRQPATEAEAEAWVAEGCWRVILGGGDEPEAPGKWPGHLVAVVNRTIAIDLTLGQARRPLRGIYLRAHAFPVLPAFLAGDVQGVGSMNGCRVVYTAEPENRGYLKARDWMERRRHAEVVRQLIAAIR